MRRNEDSVRPEEARSLRRLEGRLEGVLRDGVKNAPPQDERNPQDDITK